MSRPILIDPADGPCEICAAWDARPRGTCTRCGGSILSFQNMGGNGFQSPAPHHFHLELVGEIAGRRCRYAELCHECYLADYKAAYPARPLPKLPLVIMDINRVDDPKLFQPSAGEVLHEYAE